MPSSRVCSPRPSRSVCAGLIIDGTLPPGTPLRLAPRAARLGLSVMPVRDALRLLEADNLVVVTPRRGAAVAELSLEDAEEIYAVRVALEALCARHAAERLTADDVAELERLFGAMESAERQGDLAAFIEADHRLHERPYRTSGRERLVRHISELVARSRRYVPYLYWAWQMVEDPLVAHRPLRRSGTATRNGSSSSRASTWKRRRIAFSPPSGTSRRDGAPPGPMGPRDGGREQTGHGECHSRRRHSGRRRGPGGRARGRRGRARGGRA